MGQAKSACIITSLTSIIRSTPRSYSDKDTCNFVHYDIVLYALVCNSVKEEKIGHKGPLFK